jgi:tetratricopeptide (TPR) repeat protein
VGHSSVIRHFIHDALYITNCVSSTWPKAVPLLVLSTLLVYANCVNKTLVFDDDAWIVDVPALDDPPEYLRLIEGRPLLGVTNLVLHNLGRNNPVGHHVLNILIHLAATLTLYGVIRRSLLRPRFGDRFAGRAPYLAFAAALLWMAHPLQTQCVTYIIQRGESMAGLFYMLILYAMLRADESENEEGYNWERFAWYWLAVASLIFGYASKEIMASAPGTVILFDRIFLARSIREMIRRRWTFYLAFLATWAAFTVWHLTRAHKTEGGIGFQMEAITPLKYALTETGVILYYLQISVWPFGLAIDYQSWPWWGTLSEAMPEAAIVGGMLLVTAVLLFWRPAVGFVCAWFFIALAPTSSVLPIVDAVFEHRMYLSLASVTVLGVFLGDWLLRILRVGFARPVILAAVAIALGVLTFLRNEEYRSREVVWQVAVERMPDSVRARSNYSQGLLINSKHAEVVPVLKRALESSPYDTTALQNLAGAYEGLGRFANAADCYHRLKEGYPYDWKYWRMYAATMLLLGSWEDAEAAYLRAGELNKKKADEGKEVEAAEPHYGRAAALFALGRAEEADAEVRLATAIDPSWPETVLSMSRTTIEDERLRKYPDAVRSARTWVELGLRYVKTTLAIHLDTYAMVCAASGDFGVAAAACREGLRTTPGGPWGSLLRDRLRMYEQKRVPWPE